MSKKQSTSEDTKSTLQKAFAFGSEYDKANFKEFGDVVFWLKFLVAFPVGLLCGILPITGLPGLLMYPAVVWLVIKAYTTRLLSVDEEDFPPGQLFMDNFQASYALFLLTWVITYTALHAEGA